MNRVWRVKCSYCRRCTELVTGSVVLPHRGDLADNLYWRCAPCRAYVRASRDPPHKALGRTANEELRYWKQKVHGVFDPLWKQQGMTRDEAYAHLASLLQTDQLHCHIGWFDIEQCREAIRLLRKEQHESIRNLDADKR